MKTIERLERDFAAYLRTVAADHQPLPDIRVRKPERVQFHWKRRIMQQTIWSDRNHQWHKSPFE